MSIRIIRKIKNYLMLYKLTPQERATFELIRQEIIKKPSNLTQIKEKPNIAFGNYYDCAYTLESSIKLVLAKASSILSTQLPFGPNANMNITSYEAYILIPNGTSIIDLSNTKRAKILFNTIKNTIRKNKITNIIEIDDFDGILKYIKNFINQYDCKR